MSNELRIDEDQRESRVDLIRRIQEQQSQLEQVDKKDLQQLDSMSSPQLLGELQRIVDAADAGRARDTTEAVQGGARLAQERQEIQGQVGAQDSVGAGAQQVDGSQRSTEAVGAAHEQQTRGESWNEFRDAGGTEIPPSVEEAAREEHRDHAHQEENQRIRARDLQNQMATQNRMIKS
jgi:hypothetical protein